MNSSQRFRARVILASMAAAAVLLAASLYSTDVIHGLSYAAKAEAQYARPSYGLFDRGNIYFTSKDGTKTTAASVGTGYLVYMNPRLLSDPASVYGALSQFLALDKSRFLALAARKDQSYEIVADRVDASAAASVRGLGIRGVAEAPEAWRSYPGGSLAAHAVGLVAEDASSSRETGKYGLESYYDSVLSRPDTGPEADLFAGLFAGIKGAVFGSDSSKEGDLATSIEPTVETYLEKVLAETDAIWHPDEIGGIIMDPNTGAIVGMGSLPTFDPNHPEAAASPGVFANPLVEHVYEMGSIMKPLTLAAAFDSGAVTPDSTYDDTGCLRLAGYKVCNYDYRPRGPGTTMQTLLSESLNVGAATIAMETGSTTMYRYFKSFGLTERSGIDLPDEALPITDNLKRGADIDLATAAFGQGIAVSPIEMARALSVVANGGYLVTPHVGSAVDYEDGSVKRVDPPRVGPVISAKTDEEVKKMLVTVVDKAFRPGTISETNYSIAAKTGTAEIADPVHGGYYSNRYLHSFFGFFPAYSPRFLVFLYQVYPKGAEYASETLTKPFDELATFLINYYGIPPDR